jgi:GNAT acetyltransferase-like protein
MSIAACQARVLAANEAQHALLWDQLVDAAATPDVYYRPAYAMASEVAGDGRAIGLLITVNDIPVLVPLLLRPLSQLAFAAGEPGFDAITPYGYGGLLPLSREPLTSLDVAALFDGIHSWCRDANVVTCFLRLHPLLSQEKWLRQDELTRYATVLRFRGSTVAVDLTKWDSTRQRLAGLHERRRRALVRAQRSLRVTCSGADIPLPEALGLFREIYEERMLCLNANEQYFFPPEYYSTLAGKARDYLAVVLAWLNDKVVAGSLFMADRRFAHYHLGGSDDQGRELGATTLLMNAGAQWARSRGCTLLHLGGGLSEGDSLFEYKNSFGGTVYQYHTLGILANASRYRELVERRLKCAPPGTLNEEFFPQYRA